MHTLSLNLLIVLACLTHFPTVPKTFAAAMVMRPANLGSSSGGGGAPTPELLWLKCDEGSGTTLIDSSTLGTSTGTLSNSGMRATVSGSVCIQGNGSSYYATTASIPFGVNKVTLCFWANSASPGTKILFEGTDNSSAAVTHFAAYTDTGPIVAGLITGNTTSAGKTTSFNSSGWHHYVLFLDNSAAAGAVSGYTDGSAASYSTLASGATGTSNYANAVIYLLSRGGSSLFSPAAIKGIRIYNRILTAPEVALVYAAGN